MEGGSNGLWYLKVLCWMWELGFSYSNFKCVQNCTVHWDLPACEELQVCSALELAFRYGKYDFWIIYIGKIFCMDTLQQCTWLWYIQYLPRLVLTCYAIYPQTDSQPHVTCWRLSLLSEFGHSHLQLLGKGYPGYLQTAGTETQQAFHKCSLQCQPELSTCQSQDFLRKFILRYTINAYDLHCYHLFASMYSPKKCVTSLNGGCFNDSVVNTARHCTKGQRNRHTKLMSAVVQE